MRRILMLISLMFLIPTVAMAQLQTSPDLDYDALISEPETYRENIYMISGDVAVVQPPSEDEIDDGGYEMLFVSLDGDATRPVYLAYTPQEGKAPIQAGDTIWTRTIFLNTIPYKTTLGVYITLPLFYSPTVPSILDE